MKLFNVRMTVPLTESVLGLPDEQLVIEDAGFDSGPLSGLSVDVLYQTDQCVIDLWIETDNDSLTEDDMDLIDSDVYKGRAAHILATLETKTSSRLLKKLMGRLEWENAVVESPQLCEDEE